MSLNKTGGPSSSPPPPLAEEGSSTKQADSGGPLLSQSVPGSWVSRFFAFFSLTGFFSNRSAKKNEIQAVYNTLVTSNTDGAEKRLKSKLSNLDINSLKTLNQALNTSNAGASSSQIAKSLVQHIDVCKLILSAAQTQKNTNEYVINTFKILNDCQDSGDNELQILRAALKIAQPTTSESKKFQLYKESKIHSLASSKKDLGSFVQRTVSASLMPPLMATLNDLCYGGLADDAQQTLSAIFQENPIEAKSLINQLQKICTKLDRTEDSKQLDNLRIEFNEAFRNSSFFSENLEPISSLSLLLMGRHTLTNTQVIDNALARVANPQTEDNRTAPVPLFDAQGLFQSSSLQAQVSPNTGGDKSKISILVIDSATQASVRLDIPLPKKANAPLSENELQNFYRCIVSDAAMEALTGVDNDIKALAKAWLLQATQLYALARKEVQVPTNTRCAKNDKELIKSIQPGRIYARADGQLALTQVQPQQHNDWTVIEAKMTQGLEDQLFAEKTTPSVFEPVKIKLQTPNGAIDLSLIAKPQQEDHAHFFYVLTSQLPNGQQEISYFLKSDQGTESDSSLFARMREEKFVERHLLMTQALCIKTQNTNNSKSS